MSDTATSTPASTPRAGDESLTNYAGRSLATGENLEIVGSVLVLRDAHEPDYPGGPGYGPLPYSDALELLDLSVIPGWTTSERPHSAG